jgi:hypothetical protein
MMVNRKARYCKARHALIECADGQHQEGSYCRVIVCAHRCGSQSTIIPNHRPRNPIGLFGAHRGTAKPRRTASIPWNRMDDPASEPISTAGRYQRDRRDRIYPGTSPGTRGASRYPRADRHQSPTPRRARSEAVTPGSPRSRGRPPDNRKRTWRIPLGNEPVRPDASALISNFTASLLLRYI